MPDHQSMFRADLMKYYLVECGTEHPSRWRKFRLWVNNFGFHAVAVYRLGQFARRCSAKSKLIGFPFQILHRILEYFVRMVYHVNIGTKTIGPGFYIGHVGAIYISPTVIGSNCTLTHNVTIGEGHSVGLEGLPALGDNVWIGTGSIIYGAINIGNDVTIISGCVLSRSVPERCLVGGNPGRIILLEYDNSRLFGEYSRKIRLDKTDQPAR
jgi:serine acetyltransferase